MEMFRVLDRRSPVLEKLAELYAGSEAGKTGSTKKGYCIRYEDLLKASRCLSGERFTNAVNDLDYAEGVLLCLQRRRNLKSNPPSHVRVRPEQESELFAAIRRTSPTEERAAWGRLFMDAAKWDVPSEHRSTWLELCRRRGAQALVGKGWKPFQRQHRLRAKAQLEIVSKLLGWKQRCLLRTASAQLAGSSKFFERCLATLESLLGEASGGTLQSLANLNIEPNPTAVRFHGPIRLHLQNSVKDYEGIAGESALSESDIDAANSIDTNGPRCVTIENATTFYELCRLGCVDLLILTSYPNQATVDFLRRLPAGLRFFHFGDTDPWGFDVLLHLRRGSGRSIQPLHMGFRNWAETLPPETRARRQLNNRDRRKLEALIKEPCLADVQEELQRMDTLGSTGDFEQEGLLPLSKAFPYVNNVEPNCERDCHRS
jgi:hypothetical protein